jgi:hypothetical protein
MTERMNGIAPTNGAGERDFSRRGKSGSPFHIEYHNQLAVSKNFHNEPVSNHTCSNDRLSFRADVHGTLKKVEITVPEVLQVDTAHVFATKIHVSEAERRVLVSVESVDCETWSNLIQSISITVKKGNNSDCCSVDVVRDSNNLVFNDDKATLFPPEPVYWNRGIWFRVNSGRVKHQPASLFMAKQAETAWGKPHQTNKETIRRVWLQKGLKHEPA